MVSTHAIVLAGGKASRMGGVDKPALVVGGRRMLDTALSAVSACERIVVVGPHRPDLAADVLQTRESPPGAGPVAAVAAGVEAIRPAANDTIVVLAADLPFLETSLFDALVDATREAGAAFAVDETDRVQFLCSAWVAGVLDERLKSLNTFVNQPMKVLVPENYSRISTDGALDCDTMSDVDRARTRPRHEALSIDEARQAVLRAVRPLTPEEQDLETARGSALSDPLVAAEACPRLDVSAMDGYAVTAGEGPWHLRDETRFAGSPDTLELEDGDAVRIATGAHVPAGSAAVLRDEHVTVSGSVVSRRVDTPVRDDTRRRGEDWLAGEVIAEAGTRVTPALISAAATAEITVAPVRGPVRAHVVVTGDEIRRSGPLHTGQTRDALGPILPMLLTHCGVHDSTHAHLRDTPEGFEQVLREITDTDVLVIVGATGAGAADQLRRSLDEVGAHVIVGRVAIRPGGSQIVATLPDGRVVLGLPGNPYAAVATLSTMLPTIVTALQNSATPTPRMGTVVDLRDVATTVTRVLPATQLPDGRWKVESSVRTAHLAGLVGRDALAIVHPDHTGPVELIPLPR